METAQGVVVRMTKLTDTSLIVHWLTDQFGLIKTVAKGIRGASNPYRSRVDLFLTAEMCWVTSRKGDLHTLREVVVRDLRSGIRGSYRRVLLASYFCHLLDRILEADHPVPELFELLTRALNYLEREEPSRNGLEYFEREVARLCGLTAGGKEVTEVLRLAAGGFPASRERCYREFHS